MNDECTAQFTVAMVNQWQALWQIIEQQHYYYMWDHIVKWTTDRFSEETSCMVEQMTGY